MAYQKGERREMGIVGAMEKKGKEKETQGPLCRTQGDQITEDQWKKKIRKCEREGRRLGGEGQKREQEKDEEKVQISKGGEGDKEKRETSLRVRMKSRKRGEIR